MAKKKTVIIDVQTEGAVQNVDNLNDATKELGGSVDNVTGGAVSRFKGLQSGVKSLITSFKSLKVAIAATGIGALILAVVSLRAAFTSSEEGQNKWTKVMAGFGSVVGNVTDILANIGEVIIGIFSGDSEAIQSVKNFGKFFYDTIGLPVKNVVTTIKTLKTAITKLWDGDVDGAIQSVKDGATEIKDNFVEAGDAVVGLGEDIKNLGKEIADDYEKSGIIADKRAQARKLERQLTVETAQAELERAELLLKAEDRLQFTQAERIQFLQDAQKIDDELTNKKIEASTLIYDAKVLENSLSKSTIEDLDEEARLKAEVITLDTQRALKAKEVTTKIGALVESEKAIAQKQVDIEKKKQDDIDALTEQWIQKREDAEAENWEEKLLLEEERALEELERLGGTEEAKLNLLAYYEELRSQKVEEETEKQKVAEEKKAKEIVKGEEWMEKTRADILDSQLENAKTVFNALGQLAGDNKLLQAVALIGEAGLSIAQTIIKTQAANAIITAEGLALAIPTAGASVATAAALVSANNISAGISVGLQGAALAVGLSKIGASGAGSGGSQSAPSGGGSAPSLPASTSFNVVGQSQENQLAQTIAGQQQQPVKAYVVSTEVSTRQEMDRVIESEAEMG